jgi:hypothetical protein
VPCSAALAAAVAVVLVALCARTPGRPGRAAGAARRTPAFPADRGAPTTPFGTADASDARSGRDHGTPHAGSPSDLPELFRLLDSPTPRKGRIAGRIAGIGGDAAWAGLLARLADPRLRPWIEPAVARSAPAEVFAELKRRLRTTREPDVRAGIVRILGLTEDPQHGDDVRYLLGREAEGTVRHAAIDALGRFGDIASADVLLAIAARGGDEACAARFALQARPRAAALESVAARWKVLDPETRLAILHAGRGLERPGTALEAGARDALRDPDPRLRAQALDLLADDLAALRDHALAAPTRDEIEHALRALARLGTPAAAELGLSVIEARADRLGAAALGRHREALTAARDAHGSGAGPEPPALRETHQRLTRD